MIWWLKARRVHPYLVWGMVAFTAAALVIQDSTVIVPSFGVAEALATEGFTPISFFVPLIMVGALAQTLDNRLPSAEESGVRRVRWMDSGLIIATMAVVVVLAVVGNRVTGSEDVLTSGRSTCFLAGLMLCARALVSRSGIILPLAWTFAVIFFGRRTSLDYYEWAVTAQPPGNTLAQTCAAAALALGLVLTHYSRDTL
ncbi:hypothetical protein [Streptomyces sp. NBC_00209]|uniref:hypothetical protein n=1 Tax=Streptomyces sp. NBC_00209 TaxID=2975682 RepID=UPI00325013F6